MLSQDQDTRRSREILLISQKLSIIFSRILLAIMVTCFAVPLVAIIERIIPGWNGKYLLIVVFLVMLESLYSNYQLRHVSITDARWWVSRASQLVVILIAIKLLFYVIQGLDQLFLDIQLWKEDFRSFFDSQTLTTFLVAFCVWIFGGELHLLYHEIEGDERLFYDDIDAGYSEIRSNIRQRLSHLIITMGAIMTGAVGILYLGSQGNLAEYPIVQIGINAILTYFLCGLILLGLSQFAILRVRWIINRVVLDPKIVIRWVVLGLGLTIAMAFFASFLPTGYSAQLLQFLQNLVYLVINGILLLVYIFVTPIILLVSWIASLFRGTPVIYQPPERIQITPELPFTQASPAPWIETVKSIVFWTVLIGFVTYAFYYYYKEHPDYFKWLRKSRFLSDLVKWWNLLKARIRSVDQGIRIIIKDSLVRKKLSKHDDSRSLELDYRNPRKLNSRQQVIYYYLTLVRRGEQSGISRNPSYTPYEYSERIRKKVLQSGITNELEQSLTQVSIEPEVVQMDDELDSLTDGFVEAKYSQHDISHDLAESSRVYWEHILRQLRSIKRKMKQVYNSNPDR